MNMENYQEADMLKNKNSSCYKKLLYTSISIIAISIIIALILVIFIFSSEAIRQEAFSPEDSAGNCRIVNTKYAYDNNLSFEVHEFIQKVEPTKENGFKKYIKEVHLYAVDENKKIYDVSNNSETIGSSYEEYINKRNIINDELFVSGQFNKKNFETNIHEYFNITALSTLIALRIYYYTYKFND